MEVEISLEKSTLKAENIVLDLKFEAKSVKAAHDGWSMGKNTIIYKQWVKYNRNQLLMMAECYQAIKFYQCTLNTLTYVLVDFLNWIIWWRKIARSSIIW